MEITNVKIDIIVYADDTVIICDSIEKTKASISIIEAYCAKHGITINAKKTNWMKLGETAHTKDGKEKPRELLQNENFSIGDVLLDKVSSFKYLGVWIQSNNCNSMHIRKRKQAAYAAIDNCESISPCNLNETELITMEGNLIKKSLKVSTKSHSEPLYSAICNSSLSIHIEKRRLSFLHQLVNNTLKRNCERRRFPMYNFR
jgi:hypothetical protein